MAADKPRVFERESVEFARVLTFSDGLFAIAMTLLVVGIEVPDIPDTDDVGELWDALGDLYPSIISFVISFAVIGRYWLAHHQFFWLLKGMTLGLIGVNLVYLAFIAFLPFPTGLLGNFFENPLAFTIYSLAVAVVSGMEVVMFRSARRAGMLKKPMPDDVYRWNRLQSLSPVVTFTAGIPVAFALSSEVAVVVWLLAIPFQAFTQRWKPDGADEYLASL